MRMRAINIVDKQVKVDRLQAAEGVRIAALDYMRRQIQKWNVTLPSGEPLVLDFGLADFQQTGLVECWIANEVAAGYCGKYLFLANGQWCPEHFHECKHETFFVVHGNVEMIVDGVQRSLAAGGVLAMVPGCKHSFGGAGPALILELSSRCLPTDNRFTDARIDTWLRHATEVVTTS